MDAILRKVIFFSKLKQRNLISFSKPRIQIQYKANIFVYYFKYVWKKESTMHIKSDVVFLKYYPMMKHTLYILLYANNYTIKTHTKV